MNGCGAPGEKEPSLCRCRTCSWKSWQNISEEVGVSIRKDMCQCAADANTPHTELAPAQELGMFWCESCVSLVPIQICNLGQREKGKALTVAGDVGFARLLSWEENSMLAGCGCVELFHCKQ